jgi:hypothetical protein
VCVCPCVCVCVCPCVRVSVCVQLLVVDTHVLSIPMEDDDVITSPYNSMLALHCLTDFADCVVPIENQVCTRTLLLPY